MQARPSSGKVFADLGLKNAGGFKAELAVRITAALKRRRAKGKLTVSAA